MIHLCCVSRFYLSLLFSAAGLTASYSQYPEIVFDRNLAKGASRDDRVEGGIWNRGWQTTGTKNERIVFDAGYYTKNGLLEVSFTISEKPWVSNSGIINRVYKSGIIPDTESMIFDPPGEPLFGNDWVLVLSQKEWF